MSDWESGRIDFYRNTPMLSSRIKGIRVQLRDGSACLIRLHAAAASCPVCLQRGPPPQRLISYRNERDSGIAIEEFNTMIAMIIQKI
jgi:hypothetical protein